MLRAIGDMEEPEVPIREQLLVFAKELNYLYHEEREKSVELERAYGELTDTYSATIKTLAYIVEAKDSNTRRDLDRAQVYGLELTNSIDPDLVRDPEVGFGFLLHDIGKVSIPESILGKPGPLTEEEWRVVRAHPVVGAQMVEPMRFLGEAVHIIRCHHERFDGKGYPGGLGGRDIPLAARIFTVVDSFDAMMSDRPYRDALSIDHAMDELLRGKGTQFDPEVVEMFMALVAKRPWGSEDPSGDGQS